MFRILKAEIRDIRHVMFELIMLPRDVESRFCTTHSDAEYSAVNWRDFTVGGLISERF